MNATGGAAVPTAVAMPSCTSGADLYNTSTHSWSCVSTGGSVTDNVWIPFGGNLDGTGGRDTVSGIGFGSSSNPSGVNLVNGTGGAITGIQLSQSATQNFYVPYRIHRNWSGTVNLYIEVGVTADAIMGSTDTIKMTVETACAAAGGDMLALSYNTLQTVTLTTPTSNSGKVNRVIGTLSGMTMTGCSAGNMLWMRIGRTGGSGGDTFAGSAYTIGATLEYSHS